MLIRVNLFSFLLPVVYISHSGPSVHQCRSPGKLLDRAWSQVTCLTALINRIGCNSSDGHYSLAVPVFRNWRVGASIHCLPGFSPAIKINGDFLVSQLEKVIITLVCLSDSLTTPTSTVEESMLGATGGPSLGATAGFQETASLMDQLPATMFGK